MLWEYLRIDFKPSYSLKDATSLLFDKKYQKIDS